MVISHVVMLTVALQSVTLLQVVFLIVFLLYGVLLSVVCRTWFR